VNTAAIGRRAWQLYRVLVTLIALACLAQLFLAGRGVFGIRGDASLDDQSSLDPHRALGNVISVAALVGGDHAPRVAPPRHGRSSRLRIFRLEIGAKDT